MKPEDLFEAIGELEMNLPVDRPDKPKKTVTRLWAIPATAVTLAACIVLCSIAAPTLSSLWNHSPLNDPEDPFASSQTTTTRPPYENVTFSDTIDAVSDSLSNYALVSAKYPQMPQYPYIEEKNGGETSFQEWCEFVAKQQADYAALDMDLDAFLSKTAATLLGEVDENGVYSPLNVYLALAMLAETGGGNSRQQILDLLGADDLDELHQTANALWEANYRNDGVVTSILGSSLWLHEDVTYNEQILQTLASSYYASSFSGELGSDEMDATLREWLSEQTGGLLDSDIQDVELSSETVLAIATTIYFSARWEQEFLTTEQEVFHGTNGDVTCSFMKQRLMFTHYYEEEGFSAVGKDLIGGEKMWLIRPDDGVKTSELLKSGRLTAFVTDEAKDGRDAHVELSLPKFEVQSSTDLVDGLKSLGVTDVFDSAYADFSPLLPEGPSAEVSKITHAATVKVDEEGCTAAAFTLQAVEGTAAPQEILEVDFTLDEPFVFVITSTVSTPLFIGVINQM